MTERCLEVAVDWRPTPGHVTLADVGNFAASARLLSPRYRRTVLTLDEAMASTALFVIVFGADGQKRF